MNFLGVDHSLSGRRWIGPDAARERAADAICQETGLDRAIGMILARQGVAPHEAEAYLSPALRDLLPDPRKLKDMDIAAQRLVRAAIRKERIAVFADYDVDGGTSAALLSDWFGFFGLRPTLYVPDRIDEGYGPNVPAMTELGAVHDLIICVDCGTLSHDAIAAGAPADVIVLDHHLGGETLPDALAVVNPNRQDEDGELAHLCAAAVVFLSLVEANRHLRARGDKTPDLLTSLDLVALATVADVAPLIGVNRAFVRQGLTVMARRTRPGLVALSDVARLEAAPSPYHLGYVLGPRINAGGRVGAADLGARLLSTQDVHEAAALAQRLDSLNDERREIEAQVREAAMAQLEALSTDAPLAWAAGDGWHPGVVGIVASRVKEATHRPSIVIGFDGDVGKGSGRSITGVDLGAAIQTLAAEGLLLKGGGHRMAAGLTVTRDKLDDAMARLSDLLERQGSGQRGVEDLTLDGLIMAPAATGDLIRSIERAGPFGSGSPNPRFAVPDVTVAHARPVGDGHLKLTLKDAGGTSLDAIAFSAAASPMGVTLSSGSGERFHVVGHIEINHWQGRERVQLRLEDAARSNS
ncbi:single-stranded-DNA-specific exonuclease RecJ [Aestuariibius sp. 2305UL40-4]|uniref:single-stranded-DNA-specific exonuclease RecJ n=1 Tax=Aestuariibius violaceus TaxID=3234132 RepID=UPI00345E39A8